jgi:hypothetical protein
MTNQEALVRKKIIQTSLNGRRETSALFAVFCELWQGNLAAAYAEKREATKIYFTFQPPENWIVPKPLDPDFPWNFFGHLPGPKDVN